MVGGPSKGLHEAPSDWNCLHKSLANEGGSNILGDLRYSCCNACFRSLLIPAVNAAKTASASAFLKCLPDRETEAPQ